MSLENLTVSELQERCEQQNLFPCRGRGITKRSLIKKLKEAEASSQTSPTDTFSSSAEEEIQEHDPDFYRTILPHMNEMPDMRPKKALEKFKIEEQNNWAVLLNELKAINLNEDHKALLNAINSEDRKQIDRFIGSESSEEFVFSYPALTWIMLKISPSSTTVPFLISQGLYLEEIPITYDDIYYIRDLKTAKIIHKLYPNLLSAKEANDLIIKKKNPSGYLYWLLVLEEKIKRIDDDKLAKTENLELIQLLYPIKEESDVDQSYNVIEASIDKGFIEAVKYFIESAKKQKIDINIPDIIWHATSTGNIEITQYLLDSMTKEDEEELDSGSLFVTAIEHNHLSLIKLLLKDKRTRKGVNDMGYEKEHEEDLLSTKNPVSNTILALLIEHRDEPVSEGFLKEIIRRGTKELLTIVLDKDHKKIQEDDLREAIESNNLETFEVLLQYHVPYNSNNILSYAISRYRKEMVKLLLDQKKVKEEADLKWIEKARKLI